MRLHRSAAPKDKRKKTKIYMTFEFLCDTLVLKMRDFCVMLLKSLLFLMLLCLCFGSVGYAQNLPDNPWQTQQLQTKQKEKTVVEDKQKSLPANPWQQSTNSAIQGEKVHYSSQYSGAVFDGRKQPQRIARRHVGGVGRIGYTYKPRQVQATPADDSNDSSVFDGLLKDTPGTPTVSAGNDITTEAKMEYESMKNKAQSKFNSFTAPVTNAAKKWWNAVQDLLK